MRVNAYNVYEDCFDEKPVLVEVMAWCHQVASHSLNYCSTSFLLLYGIISQTWVNILTHWGLDKVVAILQTKLSNTFSWMKILEFWLNFHWSLFLWVQLTIFQHWFRQWLDANHATSHWLNQCWLVFWYIYASLGLNELRHERTRIFLADNIFKCIFFTQTTWVLWFYFQ